MNDYRWVPLKDAAVITGTSVRTIWRHIRDFNLDTGKEGRRTLVNLGDLKRAMKASPRGNPRHGAPD